MRENIKLVTYLLVNKRIEGVEKIKEFLSEIQTYLPYTHKLYIFNYTNNTQKNLIDSLLNYKNIEYVDLTDKGQVINYKNAVLHSIQQNADYVTIMEPGYYFEDDCYKDIKRKLIYEEIDRNVAVITPQPVYTCESKNDCADETRLIKGCKLIGTFINLDIYKQTSGFYEPYYQTTFYYDYCLMVRKMGYSVLLYNNLVLRNKNYKVIYKNVLWHSYTGYERDIYDVYYETRNRLYLWNKYKDFDPEYIRIDKKQQGFEIKEMRLFEKHFREKRQIINQERIDYKLGKMGQNYKNIKF